MGSVMERFLWVINFLARNGFVVIPVSQLEQDSSLMDDRTAWAQVRASPHSTLKYKTLNRTPTF